MTMYILPIPYQRMCLIFLENEFGGTVFSGDALRGVKLCRHVLVGPGANLSESSALSAAIRISAAIQDEVAPDPNYTQTARARRLVVVGDISLDGFDGVVDARIHHILMSTHPHDNTDGRIDGRTLGDSGLDLQSLGIPRATLSALGVRWQPIIEFNGAANLPAATRAGGAAPWLLQLMC